MASWGDIARDGGEVQGHRRRIAPGQDQPDRLALPGADGAKDVGSIMTIIAYHQRP